MARSVAHAHVRACHVRAPSSGGHEAATHAWVVAEVARLMRLPLHDERCAAGPCAFCVPDDTLTAAQAAARRAYARLCDGGPVRLKLPHGVGGSGQVLLRDAQALDAALATLSVQELRGHGVVLERHLLQPVTFSVGETHCAGVTIAYCGIQSVTRDGSGREAYGGSELYVTRGNLDMLLAQALPPRQRAAVV